MLSNRDNTFNCFMSLCADYSLPLREPHCQADGQIPRTPVCLLSSHFCGMQDPYS